MKKITTEKSIYIATRMKSELIYNLAKAEDNPLTVSEIETVIEGITIKNRQREDIEQVKRLLLAWNEIINQVKSNTFAVSKDNFIKINTIIATNEALEVGDFRNLQVTISGVEYMPPAPHLLNTHFNDMINKFNNDIDVENKSFNLFLQSAKNQYFFDGNKRTAQLMMNGYLMSEGYSLFSIEPHFFQEYNQFLKDFYESNDSSIILPFMGKLVAHLDTKYNLGEQEYPNLTKQIQRKGI